MHKGNRSDGRSLNTRLKRFQVRVRRRVPPGFRLLLGALLIVGGVLGFLPILGFWMIPLGVAVAALDVMPLWRAGLKRAGIASDQNEID
ncbi:hypothetical protein AL036_08945 [Salipiger aestuarii]|uniref:Uncharacterized protein n=1 Tax=Salipiger aestuarii TaxID=568098 RepID=A0A327YAP0_9RHOB|nr:hypothetical protein [Salipiger aestuarii]EIE50872.1 hypothetical protein C357_11629 [Citreicella sp. 357]KAA8607901.1 hypothetical protein AL036_08945 [Salipiger aestuarii]KAA8611194.1 hypothetical protein AL037_10270 [Salipiger aestuarii]KAB2541947.1 hypothetical protein AL035_09725 [Salipiger aestuarii]RAK18130.1 hypothetical protein ATI53_101426 [Salipiger aestuarii]